MTCRPPGTARDVRVGDELAPFERESGFEYWNRYAAVNDEFIAIHMSDEAGQEAGYPAAFGMGNLTWAYLHVAIHRWFGEDCRIASVATQFRSAVVRGTRISIRGTVSGIREEAEGRTVVDLDLTAVAQDGTLLAPGKATVELGGSPDARP